MDCISQGYDLILLASTFSIFISQGLSSEDIAILSAFFAAVGDNLAILTNFSEDDKKHSKIILLCFSFLFYIK